MDCGINLVMTLVQLGSRLGPVTWVSDVTLKDTRCFSGGSDGYTGVTGFLLHRVVDFFVHKYCAFLFFWEISEL